MKRKYRFYTGILCSAVLLVWFSQDSINAYWQQTYHQKSPLTALDRFAWWKTGAAVANGFNDRKSALFSAYDRLAAFDVQAFFQQQADLQRKITLMENKILALENKVAAWENQATPFGNNGQINRGTKATMLKPKVAEEGEGQFTEVSDSSSQHVATTMDAVKGMQENTLTNALVGTIVLRSQDQVLLAGDSLMQAIAPNIQKYLQTKQIKAINLSKQSTGLSYPSFFNWPKTIEQQLVNNKKIKLLIMLIGPNDPWNFPDPKTGKELKFQSPEWESVYTSRIQRILDTAVANQVQVLWLEAPFVKRNKLNQQVTYLNGLYQKQVPEKGVWLPTRRYLSQGQDHYVDSVVVDGQRKRLRINDGIHFSSYGQQFLANYVVSHIRIAD